MGTGASIDANIDALLMELCRSMMGEEMAVGGVLCFVRWRLDRSDAFLLSGIVRLFQPDSSWASAGRGVTHRNVPYRGPFRRAVYLITATH